MEVLYEVAINTECDDVTFSAKIMMSCFPLFFVILYDTWENKGILRETSYFSPE